MKKWPHCLFVAFALSDLVAAVVPSPAFSLKYDGQLVSGGASMTGGMSVVSGEIEVSLPERHSSTVMLYRAGNQD